MRGGGRERSRRSRGRSSMSRSSRNSSRRRSKSRRSSSRSRRGRSQPCATGSSKTISSRAMSTARSPAAPRPKSHNTTGLCLREVGRPQFEREQSQSPQYTKLYVSVVRHGDKSPRAPQSLRTATADKHERRRREGPSPRGQFTVLQRTCTRDDGVRFRRSGANSLSYSGQARETA